MYRLLRPVPQTFSMIFQKFSKTAHKLLVTEYTARPANRVRNLTWFFTVTQKPDNYYKFQILLLCYSKLKGSGKYDLRLNL